MIERYLFFQQKYSPLLFFFVAFALTFKIAAGNHMDRQLAEANEGVVLKEKSVENHGKILANIDVRGIVTDSTGEALPGVTVLEKDNPTNGTITNQEGRYIINVADDATLIFKIVGLETQEILLNGRSQVDVVLKPNTNVLEEAVVVGFGKQKRENIVGAMSSINPKDLKTPSSNLTTALAGQLAGMIAYQRSGEPGRDNAEFFIRGITTFGTGKKDPLILIDGRESSSNDLARIQPDDIEGFSILKDATTTSVYGARGANGVILVTTKSGEAGKTRFNVRFENSISSNTQNFQLADNISYMRLANEALRTRSAISGILYKENKITHTLIGDDPYLYPNNNWMEQMIKDYTNNTRLNLNINGGNDKVQYYISGTYNVDNGILKTVKQDNVESNVKTKNYEIRSNVDIALTPTTQATVRTTGRFQDYQGPIGGGSRIFERVLHSNPVEFPALYPSSFLPQVNHPLFGNKTVDGGLYANPIAESVSGYQEDNTSQLVAQIEIQQDFDFITKGLKARTMAYTERNSYFDLERGYTPFYYQPAIDPEVGINGLILLNESSATNYLSYTPGDKIVDLYSYWETAIDYDRTFSEVHQITGMLIGILNNRKTANASTLEESLSSRNIGVSGRFAYSFDRRYMAEFDFGYNGSERFAKDHRFGFFPSIGVGWNLSNEKFWEPIKGFVSNFKFRATYGLVGNDQIGRSQDRFFYLSNVNLDYGKGGYTWGTNFGYSRNGVAIERYMNPEVGWEKSYKADIGFDASLFGTDLDLVVDFYKEHRTNILMERAFIPTTMGLDAPVQANVGEAEGKGVDIEANYGKTFGNKTWLQLRGTFTYAASKLLVNEEPDYPDREKYKSKVGYSVNQEWGLVADRLFVDNKEVQNSPEQTFGRYEGGDVKYLDMNGDGKISSLDEVPIGFPIVPEIIYGFGFSFGMGAFDISAFAQGSGRSSLFISPADIQPFEGQNGLLKVIADDHWSENDRDAYAFWPRLSTESIGNNQRRSTWWMRNGSFLRIKKMEVGYELPQSLLKRAKVNNLRIYVNGLNLFAFSKFKLWDVEMGGNGLGYPVQRVYNIGINLGF